MDVTINAGFDLCYEQLAVIVIASFVGILQIIFPHPSDYFSHDHSVRVM